MTTSIERQAFSSGAPRRPTNSDPYMWPAYSMAAVFILTIPAIVLTIVLLQPPTNTTPTGFSASTQLVAAGSGGAAFTPIALGKSTYAASCALCHGADADGVPMLGKPLRNSEFVQSQSDAELHRLFVEGRAVDHPLNTSGAVMPPRGAQGLDDESLTAVVAYVRAIQDLDAPFVSVDAWDVKAAGSGVSQLAAVELTDHAGYDLYMASCAACHGEGAEGIEELGLPLSTSGFVRGLSDKEFMTFVKTGRSSWDENNTTGLDMPPKGGNPAITEDQIQAIADYLRAVQKQVMGS